MELAAENPDRGLSTPPAIRSLEMQFVRESSWEPYPVGNRRLLELSEDLSEKLADRGKPAIRGKFLFRPDRQCGGFSGQSRPISGNPLSTRDPLRSCPASSGRPGDRKPILPDRGGGEVSSMGGGPGGAGQLGD
jgi:hypothetical protein